MKTDLGPSRPTTDPRYSQAQVLGKNNKEDHSNTLPQEKKDQSGNPFGEELNSSKNGSKRYDKIQLSKQSKNLSKKILIPKELSNDPKKELPFIESPKIQTYNARLTDNLPKTHGIFFISGFSYSGLSSTKDDGLLLMSKSFPGAHYFRWDQKDEILKRIKGLPPNRSLILIGHSLGGDTAVEVANTLNQLENKFRRVDLLVTLDSFGINNDIIPRNVKKNLNFIGHQDNIFNDGPNIAKSIKDTQVINELTDETHTGMDNSEGIQWKIFNSINEVMA